MATTFGQPQTPRSVQQVTEAAQEYEYDGSVPLRYWLRSASAILKEAESYAREGDDEMTYLLLFRHAHLILAHLAVHSQAKDEPLRSQLRDVQVRVKENLKMLDILKPRINERYEKDLREREAKRKAQSQEAFQEEKDNQYRNAPSQQAYQRLQAAQHKELAVKLAQRENSRRAANRQTQAGGSETHDDDLQRRLQAIRARSIESGRPAASKTEPRSIGPSARNPGFSYPSVPAKHSQPRIPVSPATAWSPLERHTSSTSSPPALPPKPGHGGIEIPPRPSKLSEEVSEQTRVKRPATPATSYTFAPMAHLENGTPLRTLFLPPTLRTTFLRIAHKNTLANLETCAFLAGTLMANAFFVNRLVVPAQTSTSDTCEMTNESQLFDFVDSEDLMILGWIHTHPSQTCFMSSRDLHTHAGYQMMLAESVAIVCAPSKGDTTHGGDWGVYRLTDPPGKKAILNCNQPGIFHPHEVENVYTDALRPGHVVEATGLEFEVVDLRE